MRFFSYIWQSIIDSSRHKSKRSMDDVAREIGDKVYRENVTNEIYKDLYTESPECSNYRKLEKIIDLHDISLTSYLPGDRIIGCLDSLGWVVVRCI